MFVLRWIIVALAAIQGGWLAFDGARALTVGDYVTPSSGANAGQLGPWSKLVSALGFNPRGMPMKCLHVMLGALWLVALVIFIVRPSTGWWALLGVSIASLWYLPIGTVIGLVEIGLLMTPYVRGIN